MVYIGIVEIYDRGRTKLKAGGAKVRIFVTPDYAVDQSEFFCLCMAD